MKVTITGNHRVDAVDPGGTLNVNKERALLLARQGHISWNELRPQRARKTTKKRGS